MVGPLYKREMGVTIIAVGIVYLLMTRTAYAGEVFEWLVAEICVVYVVYF